jgi:hypothetical protein
LTPVRLPDRPRRSGGALDVFGVVSDGVEVARPGQRLRILFAAGVQGGPARNVRLELQLPPYVRPLRLPRGARFDRRGHRVLLHLPRLRAVAVRAVPARVSRRAPRGAPLELIVYARAPRDRMPLSDRWVDRGRIGRRERRARGGLATAAAGRRFGVCVLGPRL